MKKNLLFYQNQIMEEYHIINIHLAKYLKDKLETGKYRYEGPVPILTKSGRVEGHYGDYEFGAYFIEEN